MKASDMRDMTPDQLHDQLVKLKKEQFNLRFQMATGQLENTARARQVRRDIARVWTLAKQKMAAAGDPDAGSGKPEAAPAKAKAAKGKATKAGKR